MRRISTLLLAAGLAAAPSVAQADQPCRDAYTESFDMMSMGKGRLGVFVLGITPELRKHYGAPDDRGVLVARVEPGTPAATAGLQAGDIITDVGGRAIDGASELLGAVSNVPKDKTLDLKVVRDRKTLSLTAKLTTDPVGFMDFDWFHDLFRHFEQQTPRASSTST
jgi:membrane-associated protease RseP (regulator of RpoE activity)